MIDDEIRAAFARHEHLAPSVDELRSRLASRAAGRARPRPLASPLAAAAAVVAVTAAAVAVPALHAPHDASRAGGPAATAPARQPAAPGQPPARTFVLLGDSNVPGAPAQDDSVMLLHVARGGTRAYLIALPPELRVDGEGRCTQLGCVADRDPQAGVRQVVRLTGVPVDAAVTIRLPELVGAIDALGGIDVEVEEPFTSPLSDRTFPAGRQHLSGAEALDYTQQGWKPHPVGSVERAWRQQEVLAALLAAAHDKGVTADLDRLTGLLAVAGDGIDATAPLSTLASALLRYRNLVPHDVVAVRFPLQAQNNSPFVVLPGETDDLFAAVRQDAVPAYTARHPELVHRLVP